MSEKTELPTPKRIRDAHEKGQFLFSREIVAGAILIGLTGLFFLIWPKFAVLAISMMDVMLNNINRPFQQAFPILLGSVLFFGIVISGATYAVSFSIAILANISQTGIVFSGAKLSKGLQAINFISNAKQMFAPRNLFNFAMNIIKMLSIGYVAFLIVKGFIGEFFSAEICGLPCIMWSAARALGWLFGILAALYIPIAVLDFIFQRYFYLKELKMTKEEVKREYKEMEGSPEIKAHRRQAHREILDDSMLNSVRKASVIVKNPSHYAVALLYDQDKTPLPIVIGKGEGAIAREILKIAEQENIPVYENVELAQGLFHDIELGHYITSDFIMPVAEALRYIAQIKTGA